MQTETIFCCECRDDVSAYLVDGRRTYPHRPDLADLPFWECPGCGNFVGCHHKTDNPTQPLGCIPNKAIKQKRSQIHRLLESGQYKRHEVYNAISKHLGWRYHTAELRTLDECDAVIDFIKNDLMGVLQHVQ